MDLHEDISDAVLWVAWLRRRNVEVLAVIVHRHAPMVMGVCRRQCRTETDAEDAFQITFMLLTQAGRSIRSPSALPGWLHATANRVACRTRRRAAQTDDLLIEEVPDPREPLDQINRRQELQLLDEELSVMPEKLRTALVMHYLEGCTVEEVAKRLETSCGAVRGRLQRGRSELRRRLIIRGGSIGAAIAALHLLPTHAHSAELAAQSFLDKVGDPSSIDADIADLPLLLRSSRFSSMSLTMISSILATVAMTPFLLPTLQGTDEPITTHVAGSLPVALGGITEQARAAELRSPFILITAPPQNAPSEPNAPAEQQPAASPQRDPANPFGQPRRGAPNPAAGNPFGGAGGEPRPADGDPFGGSPGAVGQPAAGPRPSGGGAASDPFGTGAASAANGPARASSPKADTPEAPREKAASRFIGRDDSFMQEVEEKLDQPYNINLNQIPLQDALRNIGNDNLVQFVLDTRALKDDGLTGDIPVSVSLVDVSLYTLLEQILSDHDLTLRPRDGFIEVTTVKDAEDPRNLLRRVYWLDGTGLTPEDAERLLQTPAVLESWQTEGGTFSTVALEAGVDRRPAVVLSAPYAIHRNVDDLLKTFRQDAVKPVDASAGSGGASQHKMQTRPAN